MAHAEKCPICGGRGTVQHLQPPQYTTTGDWEAGPPVLCYGCGGKGWVEVADGPYYTIQPSRPLQYDATGDPVMPPNSTGDDLRWPNTAYTYSG